VSKARTKTVDGHDRGDGSGPPARVARWVERTEDLAEVVEGIGSGPLAVDSEADSFHHYHERVCLIQLSYGRHDVLVDALSQADLSLLDATFRNRDVRKILHGADYDVRMLYRDCGLIVRGLFDTMVAARLLGERSFGLSALLERFLDVRLDKRFQRADWSKRPLEPEMARYAMLDTRHLEALAGLLEERLGELGRTEWAAEEFRRVERLRWEGDRGDGEAWLRVKGIRALDRRQLAVVRELADLRERTARERDVPPFRVMRDEVLVALALAEAGKSVTEVRGLPRTWTRGSGAQALRAAVDRGLGVDARDCPELPRPQRTSRRNRERDSRVRRLCRERDRVARQLGLEPAMLVSRAVIERIVAHLDEGKPIEAIADLRQWQRQQLGPVIDAAGA
jgi:ribonuclease D